MNTTFTYLKKRRVLTKIISSVLCFWIKFVKRTLFVGEKSLPSSPSISSVTCSANRIEGLVMIDKVKILLLKSGEKNYLGCILTSLLRLTLLGFPTVIRSIGRSKTLFPDNEKKIFKTGESFSQIS